MARAAALVEQDWERVHSWIDELPAEERQAERWRYWKGRALQKLGYNDQAMELLTAVARDRTYYAFLAADRIGDLHHLDGSDAEARLEGVTEFFRQLFGSGDDRVQRREFLLRTATQIGS